MSYWQILVTAIIAFLLQIDTLTAISSPLFTTSSLPSILPSLAVAIVLLATCAFLDFVSSHNTDTMGTFALPDVDDDDSGDEQHHEPQQQQQQPFEIEVVGRAPRCNHISNSDFANCNEPVCAAQLHEFGVRHGIDSRNFAIAVNNHLGGSTNVYNTTHLRIKKRVRGPGVVQKRRHAVIQEPYMVSQGRIVDTRCTPSPDRQTRAHRAVHGLADDGNNNQDEVLIPSSPIFESPASSIDSPPVPPWAILSNSERHIDPEIFDSHNDESPSLPSYQTVTPAEPSLPELICSTPTRTFSVDAAAYADDSSSSSDVSSPSTASPSSSAANIDPLLRNSASPPAHWLNATHRIYSNRGTTTSAESSAQLDRRILPARSVRATRSAPRGSHQQETVLELESQLGKRKESSLTGTQSNQPTSFKSYSDNEVDATKRSCKGFGPPAYVFSINAFPTVTPPEFKIDRENRRQLMPGAATCAIEASRSTVKVDNIVESIEHKFIAAPFEFSLVG